MTSPQLYIFAGPNGAGKSSVSATFMEIGTSIFDGDKEFLKLKKTFDQTDSGDLYAAVNGHIFTDWKNKQFQNRDNCGFETNFRSGEVMDTFRQFKEKGYQVHLHFFGLDSIEVSIQRVQLRVAGGGHDVSPENIRANYTEGMKNLKRFTGDFDSTTVYQNIAGENEPMQIAPLLKTAGGKILEQIDRLPDWLEIMKPALIKRKRKGLTL